MSGAGTVTRYELATPLGGSVRHIVRAYPGAYYGLFDRMTWQHALCGVSGRNGMWPSRMMRYDHMAKNGEAAPVDKADCPKCLKLWNAETEPTP